MLWVISAPYGPPQIGQFHRGVGPRGKTMVAPMLRNRTPHRNGMGNETLPLTWRVIPVGGWLVSPVGGWFHDVSSKGLVGK